MTQLMTTSMREQPSLLKVMLQTWRSQEKIVTFTMVDLHYIHNGKQIHITFAEYNACECLHFKIQC